MNGWSYRVDFCKGVCFFRLLGGEGAFKVQSSLLVVML